MPKYLLIFVLLIAAAGISWSQITLRKSAKEITVSSDFDITSDTTAVMIESDMVTVQGGTFAMGGNKIHDGKPIHNVSISSFKIAKHETTQEIWQKVMGSNPSSHNLGSKPTVLIQFPCMDCPVDRISWDDVQVFIKKLNTLTGKNYRLPTEAEWEYAARGGKHSKNFEYSGSDDIIEVAWTSLDSGSNTHPVGQKKANELGLYDMSGNVFEWCEDWYDENYYEKSPANDPKCVTVGEYHVSRGGNWANPPRLEQCSQSPLGKDRLALDRLPARFFQIDYQDPFPIRSNIKLKTETLPKFRCSKGFSRKGLCGILSLKNCPRLLVFVWCWVLFCLLY